MVGKKFTLPSKVTRENTIRYFLFYFIYAKIDLYLNRGIINEGKTN